MLYPSIIDCGDSVSVELRETKDIALRDTKRGLFRLCALRFPKVWKEMSKQIPRLDEFSIFYVRRGNRKDLVEAILTATFNSTFLEGQPLPRNARDFEKRLEKRSDLYSNLELVADYVETCLRKAMLIEDSLPYQTHPETCHDISIQLENLMPKKFPSNLTLGRLREYPRYISGILYRLEKLGLSSQQELERIEKIGSWWERYCSIEMIVNEKVTNFRWLLEEYRISLFAQSLGTKGSCFRKKAGKRMAKIVTWRGLSLIKAGVLSLFVSCTFANDDPFESGNRNIHGFNEYADAKFLRPIAKIYEDTLPANLRSGVTNFFSNLESINNALNSALQMKMGESLARINSLLLEYNHWHRRLF